MKKLKQNTLIILLALSALLLLITLNLFIGKLSDRCNGLSIDLTESNIFQLEQTTAKQLVDINKPVDIMVLATESDFIAPTKYNLHANEIFKQFDNHSSNINLSYIDYIANPTFSKSYPNVTMKHGDILVAAGDNYTIVATENLFNYETTQQGGLKITSSKAEFALSEAIMKVTSDNYNKLNFTTGHLERKTESFSSLLSSNSYDVSHINLTMEDISNDVDLLIIVSPVYDFSELELSKLDAFLSTPDKNILYFADATKTSLPNLETFIRDWGISIESGVVFETDETRVFEYQPFFPKVELLESEIGSAIYTGESPIIMPISKPLSIVYENKGSRKTIVLTQFDLTAGVRPDGADDSFTTDQATMWGPIPSSILSTKSFKDNGSGSASNLVTFSSSEMVVGSFIEAPVFGNAQYILGVLSYLTQRENTQMIQPKIMGGASLGISQTTANFMGIVFIAIIPLLILLAGVAVWLVRRNK